MEDDFDEDAGRGKARSPRFPVVGLAAAVEFAQKIYAKEKRGEVAAEIAVQHLGYNGLNGRARRVLSAIKSFGLLTESTSGHVRVSEAGLIVMAYPPGAKEREDVIRKMAFNPPIFQKLQGRFGDDLSAMSDQNLKAKLITEFAFLDESADELIRSLRETFNFARISDSGASSPNIVAPGPRDSAAPAAVSPSPPAGREEPASSPMWRAVLPLGRGVTVEMSANADLTPGQLHLLKGHIDVLIQVAESEAAPKQ